MPAWPHGLVDPTQRFLPIRRLNDRLGDIAGHGGQVNTQGGQGFRVAADPMHTLAARLGPRDPERATGRVKGGHFETAIRQQQRERAGPAPDVQHAARAELVRDRDIYIEVAAIGVERVVDRSQPWVLEYVVRHSGHQSNARSSPCGHRWSYPASSMPPFGRNWR